MSVLLLLDQLCLRFKYRLLFREVMFILLEVMLLIPERIFLLTECLMGHLMGCLMDLIIDRSMHKLIHLMRMGVNNLLTL